MGNWALQAAVESWFTHGNGDALLFDEVFLAAADDRYDSFDFPEPGRLSALHRLATRISIYFSAVDAVLAAAGHRVGRKRDRPAGLTAREVDVLRLLARGLSAKEIATRLVITPKTARNHIEHIYAKTGTSNRVRASMFAVQHGLIPDDTAFAER